MKVKVNQDSCIGCGACTVSCPEVFEIGDEGTAVAKVAEVPEDAKNAAVEAKEGCPTSAISVE